MNAQAKLTGSDLDAAEMWRRSGTHGEAPAPAEAATEVGAEQWPRVPRRRNLDDLGAGIVWWVLGVLGAVIVIAAVARVIG